MSFFFHDGFNFFLYLFNIVIPQPLQILTVFSQVHDFVYFLFVTRPNLPQGGLFPHVIYTFLSCLFILSKGYFPSLAPLRESCELILVEGSLRDNFAFTFLLCWQVV